MSKRALGFTLGIAMAAHGLAAAAGEAAGPGPAAAGPERGWFLGAGIGAADYREPGFSASSLDYLYLQGGWRFDRHLAIDARIGANLPGGCGCDYYYFSNPFHLNVQSLYGVYLRGTVPLTPHWELYALAGYASLSLEANADLAFAGSTARSESFGLGASWKFDNRFAVDLELLPRLADGEGWRTDALNLGFHYQF